MMQNELTPLLTGKGRFVDDIQLAGTVHIAVVEVDITTGNVRFKRYIVAEDCGPLVDSEVVDGQIRGSVAQAIGSTLYETISYSSHGQPLNTTLQDYLIPSALDIPLVEITHLHTPSPFSYAGHKGVAESGTIGGPAAIVNAVADALGVHAGHIEMPLTPEQIVTMYQTHQPRPTT